ncbi:MAG: CehA/McbA family metallohydrolase [Vicinamibacterales bacterium]
MRIGTSPSRGFAAIVALAALWVALVAPTVAGPNRFGFSDRVERHLFPEVTTGPSEPAWSPDGQWIAFSMQGDIWKVPARGGEAVALTQGPWYYFEPVWSPDGATVAFTVDTGGNLDIGTVAAGGGAVTRLTTGDSVESEPAWTPDGRSLLFVSSRNRGFDIFRLSLADRSVTPVVTGAGDQIQPTVSPDGRTLAYISPVRGRLGTGGIWTQPLDGSAEPVLVHYEESEYRMRPAWLPDGSGFLFGSDEMGSNDIARVAATGGNSVVVTNDPGGEFSARPSPDGRSFAFVSNRTGPMTLFVAPIGGGPESSWRQVRITSRRAAVETGTVRVQVRAADGGDPLPARITVTGADGRSYAPDDGFARVMAVTETHYFHTAGEFTVTVPAGDVRIEAMHGFEYLPATTTLHVNPGLGATAVLRLEHAVDMPSMGWYSGDTHAHDLHQGRFGLTHESLFLQSLAEDLHVTNVLIHMDGTRLMGRWGDLTGEPDPLSTPAHLLQFSEEFRGGLGHIGMLGLKQYILPLIGGAANTPYAQPASDTPYLDGARAQGGIAGFMHPYTSATNPQSVVGSLIPVDVALGKGDFYDVASLYSDEAASTEMYYRFLNAGFRLPATGGTDNFPDVWRDPPPGTDRTYARVDGPLTVQSWMAAVKAGRTFATTGPLLFLEVNGKGPGEEVRLPAGAPATVKVRVRMASGVAVDHAELILNGRPQEVVVRDRGGYPPGREPPPDMSLGTLFEADVDVPNGGWIAVQATGIPSSAVGDSYAFAHTSPVYITRENQPPYVSRADAQYLADIVLGIRERVERGPWRSDAERDAMLAEIDRARAVYLERARAGRE